MTEQKKTKYPKFTTGRGTFIYPKLNKPDIYKDKVTGKEGKPKYTVRFQQPAPQAAALIEKIDAAYAERFVETYGMSVEDAEKMEADKSARGKAKYDALKIAKAVKPYRHLVDKETFEPTGIVEFNFGINAEGFSKKTGEKWSNKPVVFDAKGKPVNTTKVSVGNGTEGKVSFIMDSYASPTVIGVRLQPKAVQIIKLATRDAASADTYGFGAEDGFEAEDGFDAGEDLGGDTLDNPGTEAGTDDVL